MDPSTFTFKERNDFTRGTAQSHVKCELPRDAIRRLAARKSVLSGPLWVSSTHPHPPAHPRRILQAILQLPPAWPPSSPPRWLALPGLPRDLNHRFLEYPYLVLLIYPRNQCRLHAPHLPSAVSSIPSLAQVRFTSRFKVTSEQTIFLLEPCQKRGFATCPAV